MKKKNCFKKAKDIISELISEYPTEIELYKLRKKIFLIEFEENNSMNKTFFEDHEKCKLCSFETLLHNGEHEILLKELLTYIKNHLATITKDQLTGEEEIKILKLLDFPMLIRALVEAKLLVDQPGLQLDLKKLFPCNKSGLVLKWMHKNATYQGVLKKDGHLTIGQTTRHFFLVPPLLIYFDHVSNQ